MFKTAPPLASQNPGRPGDVAAPAPAPVDTLNDSLVSARLPNLERLEASANPETAAAIRLTSPYQHENLALRLFASAATSSGMPSHKIQCAQLGSDAPYVVNAGKTAEVVINIDRQPDFTSNDCKHQPASDNRESHWQLARACFIHDVTNAERVFERGASPFVASTATVPRWLYRLSEISPLVREVAASYFAYCHMQHPWNPKCDPTLGTLASDLFGRAKSLFGFGKPAADPDWKASLADVTPRVSDQAVGDLYLDTYKLGFSPCRPDTTLGLSFRPVIEQSLRDAIGRVAKQNSLEPYRGDPWNVFVRGMRCKYTDLQRQVFKAVNVEGEDLVSAVSRNQSAFYRHSEFFKALPGTIDGIVAAKERAAQDSGLPVDCTIRFCVVGLGLNEEAISIAIDARAHLEQHHHGYDFEITVCSLDNLPMRALKAHSGTNSPYPITYPRRHQPDNADLGESFVACGEGCTPVAAITDKIRYEIGEIGSQDFSALEKFDVVSAHNVILYVPKDRKLLALMQLIEMTADHGKLSLLGDNVGDFETDADRETFFEVLRGSSKNLYGDGAA